MELSGVRLISQVLSGCIVGVLNAWVTPAFYCKAENSHIKCISMYNSPEGTKTCIAK